MHNEHIPVKPTDMAGLEVFNPTDSLTLPAGWFPLAVRVNGAMYANRALGLKVIISGAFEKDMKPWIHVSVSRKSRIPTYDDLVLVKRLFIGNDKQAIQIFPPVEKHVNIHPYCLHLWHCVYGDGLPDFTRGTGSI